MKIARRAVELVRLRRHQRHARVPRDLTPAVRMALIVQKYGGTSVGIDRAHPERRAARRALPRARATSSSSSCRRWRARPTGCSRSRRSCQPIPIRASSTSIAATGEQVTIGLLAIALHELGLKARSYTGGQVRILTDSAYTKARILEIDEANMRARPRRRARRRSSPASRASTTTATSPRSAAAARTRRASRSPPRSRPTSARSTPTSTASTRPIRASCPRRGGSTTITFEEMLEMASLGLEGAADPLGRVRRQVQGEAARAVVVRGSRVDGDGHAHHVRGRREHGTGDHFRHRVQPRRGQDHGAGRRRTGPASRTRSSARSPTRTSTST